MTVYVTMATLLGLQYETEEGSAKDNGETGLGEAAEASSVAEACSTPDSSQTMDDDKLITTPELEDSVAPPLVGGDYELDSLLGQNVKQKSLFADLYDNLLDIFFPPKLPPLELTSTPIPVPDRMAVKRNPVSVAISIVFNVALLVLVYYIGKIIITPPQVKSVVAIDLDPDSVAQLNMKSANHGGGGGGEHNKIEAELGKTPKADLHPLAPPTPPKINPTLAVDPAVLVQPDIKLPDNPNMPNFGVKSSANVTLASSGTGGPAGLGAGSGNGVGTGSGSGYGPGQGGNFGGGLYSIGGDVSKPVVISSVDPEFTDEARRAKYQGVVLVGLIVDAQGNPQNVHVVRAIGYGLDEKAVEAVKQYKFKPAMKTGKGPVPVQLSIYVNFRIY